MTNYHDTRLYKSRWRSAVRMVLQRGFFRTLVRSTITQSVHADPAVSRVKGAFVLVANHTSHLDAPMLMQGLPRKQARFLSTGVGRDYFFDVWYRRIFVRWMFNAFPIDRDGSKQNQGLSRALLKDDVPILVFPEATRQMTGTMATFKPGAAALAASIGIPVIPAALIGCFEAMPKGRSWPKPGRPPVGVVFGAPLHARDGEPVTEFSQRIQAAVQDLYHNNYERVMHSADASATAEQGKENRS